MKLIQVIIEKFNYEASPSISKFHIFVTTDASKMACGASLSQNYNGIQLPKAFASRSFTKGEQNKSVIEQELTAIHWAINHFRSYDCYK